MLSARTIASRPAFEVSAVTCSADHTGWSPPDAHADHRVVLVRSGRFRRRTPGGITDLDRTTAYLGTPGEEDSFAHPAGGDVCTALRLSPQLWHDIAGETPVRPWAYVDARVDLAHRRLLAARDDLDYALTESLLILLAEAIGNAAEGTLPSGRARDPAAEHLAGAAREAVLADDPAATGLLPLATLLGVSPYRLSRAFTAATGTSLTRYRNRVRVGRALDRIEAGDTELGALAARLGFADQAHLSRTVRQHLGCTPTAVKELLRPRH
ncbi:helix-turn-helix transcriptional regulator [Phytomonospora sp. NPDC050363]|uniref:helix-turn-helix domain-containing protein n=1 Tax=Phytomonospora sp. NPDC050363 TaxID=3155642 RepID=UPI0033CF8106